MKESWIVDECPDANGHWTIRPFNGTPNGNTDSEPIATAYTTLDVAELISSAPDLLNALDSLIMLRGRTGNALFDFEEQAEYFLKETGILRHGKSQSDFRFHTDEYRISEYKKWQDRKVEMAYTILVHTQMAMHKAAKDS